MNLIKKHSRVRKLILGCAQLGLNYGIANTLGKPDESTAFQLLHTAYELGIRTLDTAVAYGTSQQVIGEYLKQHAHQSWEIITKVSGRPEQLNSELESIHQWLQTEPDIIHFHTALEAKTSDHVLETVRIAFPESKMGISIYESWEIQQARELFHPEFVQLPFSIFDQRLERSGDLQELCDARIGVHVRSVFLQGAMFMEDREFSERFPSGTAARTKFIEIASDQDLNLAQLSLAYTLSNEQIQGVLIGAESPDQLLTHIDVADKVLSERSRKSIQSIILDDPSVVDPRQW